MSTITSLVIPCVEMCYTAEYIANVFWSQGIAQVSSITLFPYPTNTEFLQMAYINIASWCDTEVAYNFLQRLKDMNKETRLVHSSEDWWLVEVNTNNGFMFNYSTSFPPAYFEKDTKHHPSELKELQDLIFDDMDAEEEAMYYNAYNNSQYVTLRPHQLAYSNY
jgi:hypothetical protein